MARVEGSLVSEVIIAVWVVHSTILKHRLRKLKPDMTFSMQYIVFLFEDSSSRHSQGWGREQRVSGLSFFRFFCVCFFSSFLHYIVFIYLESFFYLSVVASQFCVIFYCPAKWISQTCMYVPCLVGFLPSRHHWGSRISQTCMYVPCLVGFLPSGHHWGSRISQTCMYVPCLVGFLPSLHHWGSRRVWCATQ